MTRPLYCTKCGEEKVWETKEPNICPRCKGRRFVTAKPATVSEALFPVPDEPHAEWALTLGEQLFLKALKISPN